MKGIETFVHSLYGYLLLDSVNDVFRVISGSILNGRLMFPTSNLRFRSQRSNYVAYMSRYANQMFLDLDNPGLHVWNEGTNIK